MAFNWVEQSAMLLSNYLGSIVFGLLDVTLQFEYPVEKRFPSNFGICVEAGCSCRIHRTNGSPESATERSLSIDHRNTQNSTKCPARNDLYEMTYLIQGKDQKITHFVAESNPFSFCLTTTADTATLLDITIQTPLPLPFA